MNSPLSWKIIKQFSIRNRFYFTYKDVAMEYPEKKPAYLTRVLADMVNEGMICKIRRDIYRIIPLNEDPETYFPNGHQVAKYFMQGREYYIGYGSALKLHGLTLQSDSREYVVTMKQVKPAIRSFRGITINFIQHDITRFFGFRSIWINQLEQVKVSDLEKTIVDISTKPRYCGGIIGVGNAIFMSKARIDHDKLFYYFAINGNKSAKKRFLFLTDLLDLEWTTDHERMMEELGSGNSLLDPAAPNKGRLSRKFGLKINVDPTDIKKKVLHRPLY
jgi:predicted transcriptional regulator of viral defense system